MVKVGAGFLILVFAYITYVAWGDRWAAAEAAEFCNSVPIGAEATRAVELASARAEPPARAGGNDKVFFAMFVAPGFVWFRHSCNLTLEGGRVVSKAVVRVD
jgi:hypothetical protein